LIVVFCAKLRIISNFFFVRNESRTARIQRNVRNNFSFPNSHALLFDKIVFALA